MDDGSIVFKNIIRDLYRKSVKRDRYRNSKKSGESTKGIESGGDVPQGSYSYVMWIRRGENPKTVRDVNLYIYKEPDKPSFDETQEQIVFEGELRFITELDEKRERKFGKFVGWSVKKYAPELVEILRDKNKAELPQETMARLLSSKSGMPHVLMVKPDKDSLFAGDDKATKARKERSSEVVAARIRILNMNRSPSGLQKEAEEVIGGDNKPENVAQLVQAGKLQIEKAEEKSEVAKASAAKAREMAKILMKRDGR